MSENEARRPDLIVINERENSNLCHIIDVAVAKDGRARVNENKKSEKTSRPGQGSRKGGGLRIKVIVRALGTIPRRLKENFWVV